VLGVAAATSVHCSVQGVRDDEWMEKAETIVEIEAPERSRRG
jgi:hypothetical protein